MLAHFPILSVDLIHKKVCFLKFLKAGSSHCSWPRLCLPSYVSSPFLDPRPVGSMLWLHKPSRGGHAHLPSCADSQALTLIPLPDACGYSSSFYALGANLRDAVSAGLAVLGLHLRSPHQSSLLGVWKILNQEPKQLHTELACAHILTISTQVYMLPFNNEFSLGFSKEMLRSHV